MGNEAWLAKQGFKISNDSVDWICGRLHFACIASCALHQTRTLGAAHPVEAAIVFVHMEEGGGVDLAIEG